MHKQHRNVARHRVELLPGGVAALSERGVVVAKTDDQVDFLYCCVVSRNPLTNGLQKAGNILDLAIRRREEVCRQCLHATAEDMAMRIDEARQKRTAFQVDHLSRRAAQLHNVCLLADRDDVSTTLGNRLGAGHVVVDRDHRTTCPDAIRRLRADHSRQRQKGECNGPMFQSSLIHVVLICAPTANRCVAGHSKTSNILLSTALKGPTDLDPRTF